VRALVTGGAGYIGSHTCVELLQADHEVVVFDNFCNSHPAVIERIERIAGKTPEVARADVRNTGALQDVSSMLTVNYGFTTRTVNDFMWILNTRKNNETEAHKNAFLIIKNALFRMSADQSLSAVRAEVQPAIDYFESIRKRFNSSSKSDRKMRYASFYALAACGWIVGRRQNSTRALYIPYYFCLVNTAALFGIVQFCRGSLSPTWQTVRDQKPLDQESAAHSAGRES